MGSQRIFLLSPAHCGGLRARVVLNPRAQFDLARRLRSPEGAPLGDVFTFLSGLYFRGKLAYARAFASPPAGAPGILVITTTEGLRLPEEPTTLARMKRFGRVDIDETDRRYRAPLLRDARALAEVAGESCEVVLLGSVATGKYVDVLCRVFGDRLLFPSDFVGRGDMSRGGLMLRRAASGEELPYVPVAGAVRHGPRPPTRPRLPSATPPAPRP
ncbi:MAG TPA: hypothetical protein VNC59_01990 [Thermoanaerobaculia bacterium]|nr:hypothetical protein [Thermoanaerobaculia bacterium]